MWELPDGLCQLSSASGGLRADPRVLSLFTPYEKDTLSWERVDFFPSGQPWEQPTCSCVWLSHGGSQEGERGYMSVLWRRV